MYCQAVINYTAAIPEKLIPKFYAINCVYSNSSITEVWFSSVRNYSQDLTPKYAHFVANKDMQKATTIHTLSRNNMYEADNIGGMRREGEGETF